MKCQVFISIYGGVVLANMLEPLILNFKRLKMLYEFDIHELNGNMKKFNKMVQNKNGDFYNVYYYCIKSESNEAFEVNVNIFGKDAFIYVYRINEKGKINLIQAFDNDAVKNNNYNVTLNKEKGNMYIISDRMVNMDFGDCDPLIKPGWNLINGRWYMGLSDGSCVKGWYKDILSNKWYMLHKESGEMIVGWYKDENKKKYYLDRQYGTMCTGWIKDINNKWYYLKVNGEMAVDTVINGYYVNKQGQCE